MTDGLESQTVSLRRDYKQRSLMNGAVKVGGTTSFPVDLGKLLFRWSGCALPRLSSNLRCRVGKTL